MPSYTELLNSIALPDELKGRVLGSWGGYDPESRDILLRQLGYSAPGASNSRQTTPQQVIQRLTEGLDVGNGWRTPSPEPSPGPSPEPRPGPRPDMPRQEMPDQPAQGSESAVTPSGIQGGGEMDAKDGLQGAATGFAAGGWPGAILGGLGGLFFGGGGSDRASREAMSAQVALARQQMDIQQRQANMDLPMRKYLFDALQSRLNRKAPVTRPGTMTYSNPFAKLGAGSIGLPSSLAPALAARFAAQERVAPSQQTLGGRIPVEALRVIQESVTGPPSGPDPAASQRPAWMEDPRLAGVIARNPALAARVIGHGIGG